MCLARRLGEIVRLRGLIAFDGAVMNNARELIGV
jgi:hypothetical protein